MAIEDEYEQIFARINLEDYRRVASENERLRMKVLELQNKSLSFDINLPAVVNWIEHHYLFCIVVLLGLSYLGGFLVEAYETRRKFYGGK